MHQLKLYNIFLSLYKSGENKQIRHFQVYPDEWTDQLLEAEMFNIISNSHTVQIYTNQMYILKEFVMVLFLYFYDFSFIRRNVFFSGINKCGKYPMFVYSERFQLKSQSFSMIT